MRKFIFSPGVWYHVDANYRFPLFSDTRIELFRTLSVFGGQTYFGSKSTQIVSGRWFVSLIDILTRFVFGDKWGFIVYMFLFFVTSFLSVSNLVKKFIKDESVGFLISLFYSFNPISLFFLSQPGIVLSYSSIPLFFYASTSFLKDKNFSLGNIFIFLISVITMTSNIRILGFAIILSIILLIHFWNDFIQILRNRLVSVVTVFLFLILVTLPFIYFYGAGLINLGKSKGGEMSLYRTPESNYLHDISYDKNKTVPFYRSFLPIIENYDFFYTEFYYKNIYEAYFLTFLGFVIFIFFYNFREKKFANLIKVLLLFSIITNGIAHYVDEQQFIKFSYNILPILSFTTSWVSIVQLILICIVLCYLLTFKNHIVRFFTSSGLLIFIIISMIPLFYKNDSLNTILTEQIPLEYKESFDFNSEVESTLFIPSTHVLFEWLPYRTNLFHNKSYFEYTDDNVRYQNVTNRFLYQKVQKEFNCNFVSNMWVFNIKNIPVFYDVQDYNSWKFITPKTTDTLLETVDSCGELLFTTISYGDRVSFYKPYDYDKWDFLIYSPTGVQEVKNLDTLFKDSNLEKGAVLINSDHATLDDFKEAINRNRPDVFIKKSRFNRHKYYIKLNNFKALEPFVLHLSQNYDFDWDLKWIDRNEFSKSSCFDDNSHYLISRNNFCNYNENIFDLDDIWFLSNKRNVNTKYHVKGNFIGNTWLIDEYQYNSNVHIDEDGSVYMVLIYKGQVIFNVLLTISLAILGILFVTLFVKWIINLIKHVLIY